MNCQKVLADGTRIADSWILFSESEIRTPLPLQKYYFPWDGEPAKLN